MLSDLAHTSPADLAGAAAVWLMGLVFLAMNVVAFCRYMRSGRE